MANKEWQITNKEWQIAMKPIHKEMLFKMREYKSKEWFEYCKFTQTYVYCGNCWMVDPGKRLFDLVKKGRWLKPKHLRNVNPITCIKVYPKCGIELMNIKRVVWSTFGPKPKMGLGGWIGENSNTDSIHKHITEDLNIKCSKNLEWKDMMRLLKTV